jgi:hypothetical protein
MVNHHEGMMVSFFKFFLTFQRSIWNLLSWGLGHGNKELEDFEQCQNPLDFYVEHVHMNVAGVLSIIVEHGIG